MMFIRLVIIIYFTSSSIFASLVHTVLIFFYIFVIFFGLLGFIYTYFEIFSLHQIEEMLRKEESNDIAFRTGYTNILSREPSEKLNSCFREKVDKIRLSVQLVRHIHIYSYL